MTRQRVIKMIKEYLLEPNSIDEKWVEALRICKEDVYAAMMRESDDGSSEVQNEDN